MLVAIGIDLAAGSSGTQALTNTILDAGTNRLKEMVSSSYTVDGAFVIYGNDGGDLRFDGTTAPVAGLRNPNAFPNNCAFLLHKVTGSGGRRGRGRMYVPGCAEGDIDNLGVLGSTIKAVLDASATNFLSDLVTLADVDACVLLHQSSPFTPTIITGLTVDTRIATQRRRLRP